MMKLRISIAVLFVIIFSDFSFASDKPTYEILEADALAGRTAPVLAHHVMVRFKALDKGFYNLKKLPANIDAKILRQALPYKNSSMGSNDLQFKKRVTNQILKTEEPLLRTYVLYYEEDIAPEKYCRKLLAENPSIEIAEPYYLAERMMSPNDPLFSSQGMLLKIMAPDAWNSFQGDTSVVIAISDNGVFQEHEDIRNSIAPNWEEIPDNDRDDDSNGYVDDYRGYNFTSEMDHSDKGDTWHTDNHGTAVAGICGATFNNEIGMVGTAGKCRIFPIKTSPLGENQYILYSYESILYAAARKVKVLNCSWGTQKEFSELHQSYIDYAVANDVAIVASGGNGGGSLVPYYPANYFGVLGVGEVNQYDNVTYSSSMGEAIDIMAQGEDNYYTDNDNATDYENRGFGGTSAAAPVVSGVVAMVRAKFPYLGPLQALEVVRQQTDDIVDENYSWQDIIPGRVNMYKAINCSPYSFPGIRPKGYDLYTESGVKTKRFNPGDKVTMKINAMNHLGAADNLTFKISVLRDYANTVTLIDSVVSGVSVDQSTPFIIEDFSFIMNTWNEERILFRVDIYGDNSYRDFFLLSYQSGTKITNFENDAIIFSVSDRGKLGFGGINDDRQGLGFVLKGYENAIYRAGIIITESDDKSVSSLFGTGPENNDFAIEKQFIEPDMNIGIINDSKAYTQSQIGVRIRQEFIVPDGNWSVAKVKMTVENISGGDLENLAYGYFFDWDLGVDSDYNRVRLFSEATEDIDGAVAAAELAWDPNIDSVPYYAVAAISEEEGAIAQAAGTNYTYTYNFSVADRIETLSSGTSKQLESVDDISMLVGMNFPGTFANGDTKKCDICFGAALTEADLERQIEACLKDDFTGVVVSSFPGGMKMDIGPQPADEYLNIGFNIPKVSDISIRISDLNGTIVYKLNDIAQQGILSYPVNLAKFQSGVYFVQTVIGDEVVNGKFVVLK